LKLQLIKREQYSRIMMRELWQRLSQAIAVLTGVGESTVFSVINL
jgi:hypothetical protein